MRVLADGTLSPVSAAAPREPNQTCAGRDETPSAEACLRRQMLCCQGQQQAR